MNKMSYYIFSKREHRKQATEEGIKKERMEEEYIRQQGLWVDMRMPNASQMRKGFRF